nr:hypothetical protein [uncultured Actinoplanes sp.]
MDRRVLLALDYAQERISTGEFEGGWVGGSLTAGLGHPRSDVDVFLLHDEPSNPPVEQVLRDGVRIDVEYRQIGEITALHAGLAGLTDDPREGLDDVLSLSRLDDAARLFYAVPAATGNGPELIAAVRERETELRRSRLMRCASIFSSKTEDVQGAVEAGDPRQQLEISGRLLHEAVEAYTAGAGQYYVGHKWAFTKLEATRHHAWLRRRLEDLMFETSLARAAEITSGRVALAQQLMGAAFALGWDQPKADDWAAYPDAGAPEWRADPQWTPIRFGATVLLEGLDKTKHLQMTPLGLLLWTLAVRLTSTDACRALVDLASSGQDPVPESTEVANYLRLLGDRGLLQPIG